MSESATESLASHATVTDAGPCKKKITIEIPADAVSAQMGDALGLMMSQAQIPGFRKGHAPKRLVEKKFGSALQDETKRQLLGTSYRDAVSEHSLRVIGEPTSESYDKVEVVEGQPLTFEVEVEVVPEFESPNADGLEILRPDAEVKDEMIEREIEKVCVNEGALEPRDDPEAGDYCTGHGVMKATVDGEEKTFHDIKGAVVQIPPADAEGKGMILGVVVDDFAKQFGSPKAGETGTVKAKGPENHEIEEIRGLDLDISFEVDRVDRIVPSPVTDIVARYGFESEEQLRDAVKERLAQRTQVQQKSAMRQQVAKKLLDAVDIELPPSLTAQQAERNLERRRMDLMYRGVDAQEIERHIAELRAASAQSAVRELKLFFILNRLAEEMGVGVEESEVLGQIANMANERGQRPEQLQQELMQSGRINMLAQQIREHKTMDALLEKAKIEDVSVEDFNAKMKDDADVDAA